MTCARFLWGLALALALTRVAAAQPAESLDRAMPMLGKSELTAAQAMTWPLPDHDQHTATGTVTCASSTCHGAIAPWHGSPVLQNEYVTWSRLDKHTRALEVLSEPRSQRIAQKLGIGDPTKAKMCLDCHTDNRPDAMRGPRFTSADGVGCEACHGAAGDWLASHVAPNATHEDNLAHGMFPVDDPIARARLCLSCHIGNRDKLVTHRIMGAGHPRLAFDLESFSMLEPAHFRLKSEGGDHALLWDGARVWAVGQAVAVGEAMRILNDPVRGHDGVFPELVLFDCYACHHPMSQQRWAPRTAFGDSQSPGVVRLNENNLLMLRALATALDAQRGAQLSADVEALESALAGRGDVHASAVQVERDADEVAAMLHNRNFDRALVHAVTLALIDQGIAGQYPDYPAAEQAYLALSSLLDFENREGWLANTAEVNRQLSALNTILSNDEHYAPDRLQTALRGLRGMLA